MANTDRARAILAQIEARLARKVYDREYWARHQQGEVSEEEAAARLTTRFRTVRLMIDGNEPAHSNFKVSLDELNFYERNRH